MDSCYLGLAPCSFYLVPILLLLVHAVLNSVSKYHSHLIQISLLYKSSPLFSLGSRLPNSIICYVYPYSPALMSLFLFLRSLSDQFLHPATHSVLPSCSHFTRLLVLICYFLLSVYRFYSARDAEDWYLLET